MNQIEIRNLNKVFKTKQHALHALNDVSLTIEKGEMVAIMGTSGSGKTTLLHILGCIDHPSDGSYRLNEMAIEQQSPKALAHIRNRDLGFVMQDFALIDHYSVQKNVLLPLKYMKETKLRKERAARLPALLEKLHIGQKQHEKVMNLSGGQKQRVAIARALINEPDIILADEPTGALDQKTSYEIIQLMRSINQEGKTVIIVTHDPSIAAHCQRIVRIEDGKIIEDGANVV
ncbi:ABC transporter ATP-binding protein [Saccharibacillus kuerlensis]|uniref:Macrolide ABC transporter ATP-binding protein n=1 Tax=Saccharibacillus kuerlensis TaxID=459527 RepID=A0ABQ2KV05_9BACL|nr:ABC transporter ATP-binding protein [Saccharibacillus kuerlensis]GGN94024.1 macrolide ABC transporter ATP-binding protein [Saccharibacillus kuerlensis]